MATPKIAAPSPQIFTSDPTEQIYARGVLDRDMSGLSGLMLGAAQMGRQGDQEAYMHGLSEANRMSRDLAHSEDMNKTALEILKQGVEMSKLGVDPSAMPSLGMLIKNNAGPNDEASRLVRMLKQSEINKNNATAANVGGDNYTEQHTTTPTGEAVTTQTFKGKNPSMIQEMAKQAAIKEAQRRGLVVNPNAPGALPQSSAADVVRSLQLRQPNVAQ